MRRVRFRLESRHVHEKELTARQRLLVITTNYVFIYLCWDIIGSRESYKVWLPPDGSGLFVMTPPTGRCFTTQQDGLHDCEMKGHRVEDFLSREGVLPVLTKYSIMISTGDHR